MSGINKTFIRTKNISWGVYRLRDKGINFLSRINRRLAKLDIKERLKDKE
jgi:hypothetical protein